MYLKKLKQDTGFTLIELLIVLVILGVVMVPVSNAVIGMLRNNQTTADRQALSHDAQISAAYFAEDVASVGMRDYTVTPAAGSTQPFQQSVQLNAAYNAGGDTCGTSTTPVAALRLLSDSWDDSVSPPQLATTVVAYYLAGTELHRLSCSGSAVALSNVVIAHNVDPATVAVSCSSTCASASVPEQVTLSFTAKKQSVGTYPITLSGQRRQT